MATCVSKVKEAGTYSANFDGSKLSGGIYFYTIKAENITATKKTLTHEIREALSLYNSFRMCSLCTRKIQFTQKT
jgi:hypothetical protein